MKCDTRARLAAPYEVPLCPASLTTLLMFMAVTVGVAAEPLTLHEAVDRTLASHPQLALAEANVDAAAAGIDEAEADRRPRIALASSLLQYEEPMVVTPIHGFGVGQFPEFDDTLIQNALNLELLLWDGGGVPARIGASEAELDSARQAALVARSGLIFRTAAAYLTALSRVELLDSHDARITALEAEAARVRQLIDVGRAADVDRLRVEAALAAASSERSTVATDLRATLRELGRLVSGLDQSMEPRDLTTVDLTDAGPSDRETLSSIAIENNPAIARARDQLRQRESAVALARSIYYPQVRAVGSWLQFGDDSLSFDDEWNVGFRVRIPIWDGGATAARVAQARAAVRAAEERVRQEELRVLDDLDAALASLEDAEAVSRSLAVAAARFEEVTRIERLKLDNGVGTQIDYLRSEADLLQARAGLATAEHRRILARIELAHVLGELDSTWLDRHITSGSTRISSR